MLILRIPSGRGLELEHGSMSRTITLWAAPIHPKGNGGYQLFFWLMRPNCLVPSCVIPSEPGLEPFSKKSNKVGLFWSSASLELNRLKILEVRHPIINFFCSR